jgi:tRNA U34 5-carboxymethylaminomethyl modifying GTPase MnmE/TrmE
MRSSIMNNTLLLLVLVLSYHGSVSYVIPQGIRRSFNGVIYQLNRDLHLLQSSKSSSHKVYKDREREYKRDEEKEKEKEDSWDLDVSDGKKEVEEEELLGIQEDLEFKSGFVSILGNPNVGKSTLLNAFLGETLCIVSAKPQTTRHRILGVLTEKKYQLVFSDTPGMMEPVYKLQEAMMDSVSY